MRRNRIIYYLLLLGSFILASFKGGPISYALLFGLILITPVCLIYLLFVYNFFRIFQEVGSKHITTYEPIKYYFVLKNEYPINFCSVKISMYSQFSYVENGPDGKEYELLPHESARYDTTLICKYRGNYSVGVDKITITDFLGLYKISYRVPEPLNLNVFPRIVKISQLRSVPELSASTFREVRNLNTYFDNTVREYVPGDSMRGIHWKSSAKLGKLQSRNTYGEQKQGISIFLDTLRISSEEQVFIPIENKCLEIALALTNFFAQANVPTTTFFQQKELTNLYCENYGDMSNYLRTIAGIRFTDSSKTAKTLELLSSLEAFVNSQIAFFVVTQIDDVFLERLRFFSDLPIVIYLVSENTKNATSIVNLPHIRLVPVGPDDDLYKIL